MRPEPIEPFVFDHERDSGHLTKPDEWGRWRWKIVLIGPPGCRQLDVLPFLNEFMAADEATVKRVALTPPRVHHPWLWRQYLAAGNVLRPAPLLMRFTFDPAVDPQPDGEVLGQPTWSGTATWPRPEAELLALLDPNWHEDFRARLSMLPPRVQRAWWEGHPAYRAATAPAGKPESQFTPKEKPKSRAKKPRVSSASESATSWYAKVDTALPCSRAVLAAWLVLEGYARKKADGRCWPPNRDLMHGLKVTTLAAVQRILLGLEDLGIIRRDVVRGVDQWNRPEVRRTIFLLRRTETPIGPEEWAAMQAHAASKKKARKEEVDRRKAAPAQARSSQLTMPSA